MTISQIPAWIDKLVGDPSRLPQRDVEEYLRAFLRLLPPFSDQRFIEVGQFLSLVEEALVSQPLDFEPAWRHTYDVNRKFDRDATDFSAIIAILQRQIVDLREMRWAGILDDKLKDFGVRSPRGETFYNFSLELFLNSAAEGMQQSSHSSTWRNLGELDWHQVMFFFWCGQNWE